MTNLKNAMQKIKKAWTPYEIAKVDDYTVFLALFKGEYNLHKHDRDEFFLLLKGEIEIMMEGEKMKLKKGEWFLVKKGVVHKTIAKKKSFALIFEYGDIKREVV